MNTSIRTLSPSDKSDFIALRAAVFGDDEAFLDFFAETFGSKLEDLILEEDGKLVSALTRFETGELVRPTAPTDAAPIPVIISYAIATDASARGKGCGARITKEAARLAHEQGALSALSPAEPSLVNFYEPLGYLSYFYAKELQQDCRAIDSITNASELRRLSPAEYAKRRETYLANRSHLRLNAESLRLAEGLSLGGRSLCEWEGKALLVIEDFEEGAEVLHLAEFLPADGEDAESLLRALAPALLRMVKASRPSAEIHEIRALTPASSGDENVKVLGLVAAQKGNGVENELCTEIQEIKKDTGALLPYLGFTFG